MNTQVEMRKGGQPPIGVRKGWGQWDKVIEAVRGLPAAEWLEIVMADKDALQSCRLAVDYRLQDLVELRSRGNSLWVRKV